MAILKEKNWERHSNPWSGYTRMAILPFLFLSIWVHNWIALGLVIVWTIVNPFIFPKPKNTDNWMSKGVLGEKLWTEKFRWDFSQFLNIVNGLFFFPALYFAYAHMFWPLLYSATWSFIAKLWFIDRMAFYYEMNKKD